MTTLRIISLKDIPAVVRTVVGFNPVESVVLVSSSGMVARVDVGPVDMVAESLRPALPNFANGVIAVLYSDMLTLDYLTSVADTLGVRVLVAALVSHGTVSSPGHDSEPYESDNYTRADMEANVSRAVHDADEADLEAVRAYEIGNGALAWAYLDRATALRGNMSAVGYALSLLLTHAVDPRLR